MGRTHDRLDGELRAFVARQHVFFVATAPLSAEGHVNLSPKGGDTLRVLDERTVCYLDLTGSGAESIAHVRENGRITLMCCAFEGEPQIVRLQGRGTVVRPGDDRWSALAELFPDLPGARSIIVVDLERISSSCGFGVPLMDFVADRDRLTRWAEARGPDGIAAYQASKNAVSIDGLPALTVERPS